MSAACWWSCADLKIVTVGAPGPSMREYSIIVIEASGINTGYWPGTGRVLAEIWRDLAEIQPRSNRNSAGVLSEVHCATGLQRGRLDIRQWLVLTSVPSGAATNPPTSWRESLEYPTAPDGTALDASRHRSTRRSSGAPGHGGGHEYFRSVVALRSVQACRWSGAGNTVYPFAACGQREVHAAHASVDSREWPGVDAD